jgi:hypothetical protein
MHCHTSRPSLSVISGTASGLKKITGVSARSRWAAWRTRLDIIGRAQLLGGHAAIDSGDVEQRIGVPELAENGLHEPVDGGAVGHVADNRQDVPFGRTDLVRDKVALAKLSAEERAAWENLWSDGAALVRPEEHGGAAMPVSVSGSTHHRPHFQLWRHA